MTEPDQRVPGLSTEIVEDERLLAMDPWEFDQSPRGWRSLHRNEAGDFIHIAQIIEKYIEQCSDEVSTDSRLDLELLHFHVGQQYACAGDEYYGKAIESFRQSFRSASTNEWDHLYWNPYVEATLAFLESDIAELRVCCERLRSTRPQAEGVPHLALVESFLSTLEAGSNDYMEAHKRIQK
jgi:hypothetical protein